MANANTKRVKSSEIELKDKLVGIQRVTKVTKGEDISVFCNCCCRK